MRPLVRRRDIVQHEDIGGRFLVPVTEFRREFTGNSRLDQGDRGLNLLDQRFEVGDDRTVVVVLAFARAE